MGIVNVTPDSFSDGGHFASTSAAVEQALQLIRQGAHLIDVGGESTRPYSEPVTEAEELRRVIPVLRQLSQLTDIPISIDTSKAAVADEALRSGAEVVNDVTAGTGDPQMLDVVSRWNAGYCAMHMQGTPQTMQDKPTYGDVVREVSDYLRERRDTLLAAGVDRDRICLDPGIGFGKTQAQNLQLLQSLYQLHALGQPLLVGHSRKGFLGKLIEDTEADRGWATAGASLAIAAQGVQVLRLHDVRATRQAWSCFAAGLNWNHQ